MWTRLTRWWTRLTRWWTSEPADGVAFRLRLAQQRLAEQERVLIWYRYNRLALLRARLALQQDNRRLTQENQRLRCLLKAAPQSRLPCPSREAEQTSLTILP
ncbi:MAG TPA: hypothetical protein VNN62_02280 [Methylomirabilota bacterium]|nr:hypothetical protein [Methylomirabilota bacterium]